VSPDPQFYRHLPIMSFITSLTQIQNHTTAARSPTSPPRRVVSDFPTFGTGAQVLSVMDTGVEKANPMFGGNAFGAGEWSFLFFVLVWEYFLFERDLFVFIVRPR
jgi:hypothetical protein